MGTQITLSLNGIDIDWGKNEDWAHHHWLFPPESLGPVEYRYASDVTEVKPGFQTTLGEVRFRLCHLGFSEQETTAKFDAALSRWNRTADLRLTFSDFREVMTGIDFGLLTPASLEPFLWDFRSFMVSLLAEWDTDDADLEHFVRSLDVNLTLRVLADRPESLPLPLRWNHQDLIDSGWATLDDLTEPDRRNLALQHTALFGRVHRHSRMFNLDDFDKWLVAQGLPRTTVYRQVKRDGTVAGKTLSLPSAVRNILHHPENPNNRLSDQELGESVEMLLKIAADIPIA